MRPIVKAFLQDWRNSVELPGPVYEFGSFQVESGDDLRPIFQGLDYVGCDLRPGPGVDRIEDLHALKLDAGTVGTAVCVDTLEHVENPFWAVREIHRVLRPGGILLLISVLDFPIHHQPDYWRFTPQGFEKLLECFTSCQVFSCGGRCGSQPETIAAIASKERNLAAVEELTFESVYATA